MSDEAEDRDARLAEAGQRRREAYEKGGDSQMRTTAYRPGDLEERSRQDVDLETQTASGSMVENWANRPRQSDDQQTTAPADHDGESPEAAPEAPARDEQ